MMVIGPGIDKGKRLDTPVYLQDIMATTLDLAGKFDIQRVIDTLSAMMQRGVLGDDDLSRSCGAAALMTMAGADVLWIDVEHVVGV